MDLAAPLPAGDTGIITHAAGVREAMAVVGPAGRGAVRGRGHRGGPGARGGPAAERSVGAAAAPAVSARSRPRAASGGTVIGGKPREHPADRHAQPRAKLGAVDGHGDVTDATGAAYQIPAGTLPADGRPHLLTASLGGTRASYPLRLAQISLGYTMPAQRPDNPSR